MSVDFTKPVATGDRAQNLTDTKDTLVAVAKQRPDLAAAGIAADMIRWSSSGSKWEIFNGSAWGDLSSAYAINVTTFNGQAASYYTNITARLGYTPLDNAGGTMTGPLTLNAAPTVDLHAATKKYVDDGLAGKSDTSHTHAWSAITSKGLNEGANDQDPSTTQSHVIVTNHANGPDSGTSYWHITTTFYSTMTGNRAQIAVQYAGGNKVYARSIYSGTWTQWVRCDLGEIAKSFGATGYCKLPGGLIVQWGTVSLADGGSSAITFPTAFPTACIGSPQMSVQAGSAGNFGIGIASSVSASGFTARLWNGGSNSATLAWFAVGY